MRDARSMSDASCAFYFALRIVFGQGQSPFECIAALGRGTNAFGDAVLATFPEILTTFSESLVTFLKILQPF